MKPTMRFSAAPRSVSDATRFTANSLHASSKTATPPPRFTSPKSGPAHSSAPAGGPGGPGSGGNAGSSTLLETPEQKVARLRAAHRRAKEAQVSKFDKIVGTGRRVFDSAHKITVAGLFGFTVIAGLVTAYTAVDMIMYNKKRSAEWVEAQKKLEADSLEAARIAYMTGKATDEQIDLVEEQLERERLEGRKTSFFSNVSVLGAPEPASSASPPPPSTTSSSSSSSSPQQPPQTQNVTETVSWPAPTSPDSSSSQEQKTGGLWSWLTSNLKREEEGEAPMSTQRRLGWESLSEEDDGTGVRDSDLVRAVEEKQAYLRARAAAALEREKANQREGGPLDRVGVQAGAEGVKAVGEEKKVEEPVAGEKGKKKGWLW